jgi:hypothetical protein
MEPLITDAELADIEEHLDAVTPGPWYAMDLDDQDAMSLVAITTRPPRAGCSGWGHRPGRVDVPSAR